MAGKAPQVLGLAWILQNRKQRQQQRHATHVAATVGALPTKKWPWWPWTALVILHLLRLAVPFYRILFLRNKDNQSERGIQDFQALWSVSCDPSLEPNLTFCLKYNLEVFCRVKSFNRLMLKLT